MTRLRAVTIVALAGIVTLPAFARAPQGLPGGVATRERGDGWVFTDAKGMTLYTFDRDEGVPGGSGCNAACATAWPQFVAPPDTRPQGEWSTVRRIDGSLQWAYRGRPLYHYAADAFPGATFGDGNDNVWHIAFKAIPLPREARIGSTLLGQVLTDAKGMTLYTSTADKAGGKPSCTGKCLREWQPVYAPQLAHAFDDWAPVKREDGSLQWAFKGKPVYRRPGSDVRPGETSGHGVDGWQAIVLEPAPPLPPWATVQPSDAGELIANEKGLTVYSHGLNARGVRRPTLMTTKCPDGACIDPQWQPFIAAKDAKPVGSWALVDLPDGRRQWTYKGQKLYTNALDSKPGEFKGIRFGGDRAWSAIMRNGEPMQGVSVGG